MSRTIRVRLNDASIDAAIKALEDYKKWIQGKAAELAKRLAEIGADNASVGYFLVKYDGPRDIDVTVESRGENTYAIVASGHPVLVIEFGAGVTYGYGHPMASEMGYGPGTYPGQVHAMTGKGWYLPKSVAGRSGVHTYGNPPSMTMYKTAKDLREDLERIAREVFSA